MHWKLTTIGPNMSFYKCEIWIDISTSCWSDGESHRLYILKEENNIDGSQYSFGASI